VTGIVEETIKVPKADGTTEDKIWK